MIESAIDDCEYHEMRHMSALASVSSASLDVVRSR